MTAPELLAALTALGATVQAVEDRLRIEAPPGALTPELRSALAEQKPALLTLLSRPPRVRPLHLLCAGCQSYFMHEPATFCYWCRSKRDRRPAGEPCHGCGEACEHCLGEPRTEVEA
jgi:hypothetical protein